jgi:hypothetical protein
MAKSRKEPVSLDAIRAGLKDAARAFLSAVAKKHPGETLYGFLFEVSEVGYAANGAAATEEGLLRYATKYAEEEGGDVSERAAEFRWGSTEDGWYQEPTKPFDGVNDLLERAEEQELYAEYSGVLEQLCLDALRELDAAGMFGSGPERERVAIGVCHTGGDNTEQQFLGWAKQVNPPIVFKRLKAEYTR